MQNNLLLIFSLALLLNCFFSMDSFRIEEFSNQQKASGSRDLLRSIAEIFKLSSHDLQFLSSNFDLKKLELIYPKNLDRLRQMKRGVLGAGFKRSSKMAAIKLEFDNSVRAKYDKTTKLINCNSYNIQGEPTEKYIANLMQNETYFIKFYTDLSKQFKSSGYKVNMYVYDRLPKSQNLLEWSERMRANLSSLSGLEKYLKKYFNKIHLALNQLKEKGYVYTDFKPENVLIDTLNDKPYLIDLESVVSSSSKFVCLRTVSYTPPLYTKEGRFIDSDGLSGKAIREFLADNHCSIRMIEY